MVTNTEVDVTLREDADRLRLQADELLRRLISNSRDSERRLAEMGRRDPMKAVTGRTALDGAISTTRELIQQMDSLVTEMQDLCESNGHTTKVDRQPPSSSGPEIVTIKPTERIEVAAIR